MGAGTIPPDHKTAPVAAHQAGTLCVGNGHPNPVVPGYSRNSFFRSTVYPVPTLRNSRLKSIPSLERLLTPLMV